MWPAVPSVSGGASTAWEATPVGEDLDRLAASFRAFAADTVSGGASPLYERLALCCAEDRDVLALLLEAPPSQRLPVLLLAPVHDSLLRDPDHPLAAHYPSVGGASDGDPWPPFRALVDERDEELRATIATRRTQTNETGRCAGLLPAFGEAARLAGGRPLALVELGSSAGLNLNWDRYAYAYETGDGADPVRAGDLSSPVRLRCRLRGPGVPPLPDPFPPVAARVGADLGPPDLANPRDVRWLRACVFPDQAERHERLEAAIAVAREHPPRIVVGQAPDVLPDLLDATPDGAVACVFHSALTGYLTRAEIERLRSILGARRAIWIAAEHPGALTPGDGPLWGEFHLTVGHSDALVRRARMGPHGQWLEWLG